VRLTLLALGSLVIAGCALRPSAEPSPRTTTATELLETLETRRAAVSSLRARARVRTGVAGRWTREAVLVQRPGDVRVDVFSPFGLALALGVRDSVLWAYPPGEGVCYQGPATPENVTRLLGAPLAVSDLIDILLGTPPARVPVTTPALDVTDEGEYRLTVPFGPGVQTIWFAGDALTVLRAEETRGSAVVFRLAFRDYRDGFPHAFDLNAPIVGATTEVTYRDVEPNAALDATLFAPPPAPRVLPLEAAVPPDAS